MSAADVAVRVAGEGSEGKAAGKDGVEVVDVVEEKKEQGDGAAGAAAAGEQGAGVEDEGDLEDPSKGKATEEAASMEEGVVKAAPLDAEKPAGFLAKPWVRRVLALMFVVALALAIALPLALAPGPKVRTYFIAAEDAEWDYTPLGKDTCHGHEFSSPVQTKFTAKRYWNTSSFDNRIGTSYTKARFVGYTDDTFAETTPREARWDHLGLLGPVLRAEVGDQIHVVFRNNARFPFSISGSGVGVTKASEGASYNDGSTWLSRVRDNFLPALGLRVSTCDVFSSERGVRSCKPYKVHAGEQYTYVWDVPESAGPGPAPAGVGAGADSEAPSSAAWLYKSNHDSSGQDDLNAGLMGPIIITAKGMGRSPDDPTPKDVDREFVMLYHAVDENSSPYLQHNIYSKITRPALGLSGNANAAASSTVVPGELPFGHLDRAAVLQALVRGATTGLDKISLADAAAEVAQSVSSRTPVGVVAGRPIHVSFARDSFDPSKYDAANGGHGAAKAVIEQLVGTLIDAQGDAFLESNMMHAVNGYMYCNQPGLQMVQGEKVRWYVMVAGSGVDIHTPHWHGHTVLANGHRHDELEMIPNTVVNADMVASQAGRWLMHCHVNDHMLGGMASLYDVNATSSADAAAPQVAANNIVTYYIAAEEVEWDFLPGGEDACADAITSVNRGSSSASTGSAVSDYFGAGGHASIGGRNLRKARYIEYTDATFSTRAAQEDPHLGILGPVVRARVGDRIKVVFRNKATVPYSIHAHGVLYGKDAEGAGYNDGTTPGSDDSEDDAVAPGATFEYIWDVPPESGPGPNDLDSKVWMYHSHVDEVYDTNSGLIGPIVIQSSDASTTIAAERFLLFNVFDEVKSNYLKHNLITNVRSLPGPRGTQVTLPAANVSLPLPEGLARLAKNDLFRKYSKKHTINGRAFCTLEGLKTGLPAGKRVRWHLLSIGDEIDFHSPSWEGHSVESMYSSAKQDKGLSSPSATVPLMPSTMHSVDMIMKPGKWGLANLASNHFAAGSRARFDVAGSSDVTYAPALEEQTDSNKIAQYYIAADEIEWDYAPTGRDMCSDQDFDEVTQVYTEKGRHRIGTKYTKAVYREYATNGLFDELRWGDQSRFNPASEHLGILGPVIKAVVGETIEIVFRNNLRADANLVAFGGALAPSKIEALNDRQKKAGSSDNHVVVPGGEVRITIPVSAAAGPVDGSKQNSVAYVYGSDVNFVADVNSGLVGAFVIHAQDGGPRWSSPTGVHREFVTLLSTFDENLSRYAEMNILKYAEDGDTVDRMDPAFKASNRMHSLNGYLHCNGPAAVAKQFQNVRWYMLSVGDSHDLHGPSVSGYTFSTSQDAAMHQVALLAPGMARSVDLNVDRWGKWLVKDAVVDNQRAGMEMFFDVAAVLHPGA